MEIVRRIKCILLPTEGVALIVESPDGEKILTVIEMGKSKEWLGKIRGMETIPMETVRLWERRWWRRKTLHRLVRDELGGIDVEIEDKPRGIYQVVPRIHAFLYVGRAQTWRLPTSNGEVGGHKWIRPQDIISEKTPSRQGVEEMVDDYIAGRRNVYCSYCRPVASKRI